MSVTLSHSKAHSPRSGQALRLINTKQLDRQDWLNVRKQGIGSSDAAAAVGLNPYQSALALWLNKTGKDQLLERVDPEDDTKAVYWGTILEPIVAQAYAKRTGHRVRRVNAVLQHPEHPWMLANLDREVVGNNEVQILECKTAGMYGSRLWEHGVPEYVHIQVMHQLAVTGHQAADVAVLIAGQELRVFRIERDEAMIAQLIQLEQRFWQCVLDGTPPEADGSDSAQQALCAYFPKDDGHTCDFTSDADLNQVFDELLQIRESINTQTAQAQSLKQRIQQAMGEASKASFRNGTVTWKRSKDSTVIDTFKLKQEQPTIAEQYQKVRAGSRRFIVQT